ncbi:maleylacetoacetate isomerase [Thalassotalea euphylliae]|uniref:Maleylacetoacetate isomerase n=1 Tax=Thalassotalea euphylliae TaxID=1655234 RepID=A0A3E0UGX9_9GAMM|nr:maleylacetoacetate isomerase [Thalassotalea euphylliae]REL35864.1 maleylacetoacetate isomerase [Thalassotalea euphylliae]
MELYSYFRSSAAYRLRIALNVKGISYQQVPVNLLKGEHKSADYLALNPQGLVPSLKTDNDEMLSQSPAILEWLEETFPGTPLLPISALERATVRSWCNQIACDIHPICNLRVLNYVADELGGGSEGKLAWLHHWITTGFSALEPQLVDNQNKHKGNFCFGEQLTLADIYLIPQVFNALRFDVDMTAFPRIMAIYQHCNTLPAFIDAQPANQPDAG